MKKPLILFALSLSVATYAQATPWEEWDLTDVTNGLISGKSGLYTLQQPASGAVVSHAPDGRPSMRFSGSQPSALKTVSKLSDVTNILSVQTGFYHAVPVTDGVESLFSIGGETDEGPVAVEMRIYTKAAGTADLRAFVFGSTSYTSLIIPFTCAAWNTALLEINGREIRLTVTAANGATQLKTLYLNFDPNPISGNYFKIGRYGTRLFSGWIDAVSLINTLPDHPSVPNGSLELPGDTWLTGGGVPDHWTLKHHDVVLGTGGTNGSPGTVGLNHRWVPLNAAAGRSVYLMDPTNAVLEQTLTGVIVQDTTYVLTYSFYRYATQQAAISLRIQVDNTTVATETCTGTDFPYRIWQTRQLSYTPSVQDIGKSITLQFDITGTGDVRLDEVNLTHITPAQQVYSDRLTPCVVQIAALPSSSASEQRRKAILQILSERAEMLIISDDLGLAEAYLSDLEYGLSNPIASTVHLPEKAEGFLPSPTVYTNNPYLSFIQTWADGRLASGDDPWDVPTASKRGFNGIYGAYGTRDQAIDMGTMFWLVTHPQSPYQNHPEITKWLLRRMLSYAEDYLIYANAYGDSLNDFFAIGPALYACRITTETYPDLLTPNQKKTMDRFFAKAGAFWQNIFDTTVSGTAPMGYYCNRDIAVANILLNAGKYLSDSNLLAKAKFLIDEQKYNLYPDGAFAYIGTQNETPGYHDAVCLMLARYYASSGYGFCTNLLIRSENYSLLSTEPGNISEFITAPSWKTTWNNSFSTGGEFVTGLTGNPYLRTLLDRAIEQTPGSRPDLLSMAYYRDDVQPAVLPDNYTVYDRNIQGARTRYGHFSTVVTSRKVGSERGDEVGPITLAGAMMTDELNSSPYPLNAAVMAVHPKVQTRNSGVEWTDFAYLTRDEKNSVITTRTAASLASQHGLERTSSGPSCFPVPWQGRQQWLALPDRIVGLVEVFPEGNQPAYAVTGRVKLGYGRTSILHPKEILKKDTNTFEYGKLTVKIHENNYDTISTKISGVLRDEVQLATDIVLGTSLDGTLRTWTPQESRYFIVEIRPDTTQNDCLITRTLKDDLLTLTVSVEEKQYQLVHNLSGQAIDVELAGDRTTCHFPRGDVPGQAPVKAAGQKVPLPPNSHLLLITSNDPIDILPGWEHFPAMARTFDSDLDGLPDYWEALYFGGTTNANPAAKAANNRNTIVETYIAGLNPTNPASVFKMSALSTQPGEMTLQWHSVSGRVYSIYSSTNLLNGFQPLKTNLVWPQNSWITRMFEADDSVFYKINVQLHP